MNYSFEYMDIILLAMIAGFIFLRLRGILGKKTGFDGKIPTQIAKEFQNIGVNLKPEGEKFDEEGQKDFLKGAQIAYETIITDFSDSDNKLIASKPLLGKKVYDQFMEALSDRAVKGNFAEITFIGIKSAKIKTHKTIDDSLEVTVDFIIKKKIRHEKIKKIDLHGYTIEEANKAVEQFIERCFDESVTKIIVITGKGLRSKSVENPYLSKDLSILKYSVPEFIETNTVLSKMIIEITDAKIEDGGSGAFYIFLKNNFKVK